MKQRSWTVILSIATMMMPLSAVAQVTPDRSLGTIVDRNGNSYEINGGTTVGGRNLFHSFDQFDVPTQGAANFLNDPSIVNIFSRVTGGKVSEIDGVLRSRGEANFFLMNPSGIMFGQNASLDVGGSFVATTANALQFPNNTEFSLTSTVTSQNSLLSVDPSAFLFNQVTGSIQVNSVASAGSSLITIPGSPAVPVRGLRVRDEQSLLLLGGDVRLANSGLNAFGGRVDIGGIAGEGRVELVQERNGYRLNFSDGSPQADVSIVNNSNINVAGSQRGDIAIQARNVEISGASQIFTGSGGSELSNEQTGKVSITATGAITLSGNSAILNSSLLSTEGSGQINLSGQSINIIGSLISSINFGQGDSGEINIQAADNISLTGRSETGTPSSISSSVASLASVGFPELVGGNGNGGNIKLQARSIFLADNAFIFTSTVLAPGKSGDIQVNVLDSLVAQDGANLSTATLGQGNAGNISIQAGNLIRLEGTSSNRSGISSSVGFINGITTPRQAGNINLETGSLIVAKGASIDSSTQAQGNAGKVVIRARDTVKLENSGFIFSNVEDGGVGRAGDIEIEANSVQLNLGGQVQSFLRDANPTTGRLGGKGRAGNVRIAARDTFLATGVGIDGSPSGVITGVGVGSEGDGGDIYITAPILTLSEDGLITAETFGVGRGGNITLKTNQLTGVAGGQISAGSGRENQPGLFGRGGDITINADTIELAGSGNRNRSGIFAETSSKSRGGDLTVNTRRLSISNGAAISSGASGSGSLGGDGGNLTINASESINIVGRERKASTLATESNFDQLNGVLDPNDPVIAGQLSITTDKLTVQDGGAISTLVTSNTVGTGGDIAINANRLDVRNNSQISSSSFGFGRAGDIDITANGLILLQNNSDITTINETGDGGNIRFRADAIVALRDSDILAFAPQGKGGNITFDTRAFLSDPLYRSTPFTTDLSTLEALQVNGQVDVNATGAVSGSIAGIPDITFLQNSLTQLPQTAIDTNTLLANSCIARNQQDGSFYITGSGGLLTNPGELSTYPTGTVQPVDAASSWKRGEAIASQVPTGIVEPQGVYQLPNGQLVLSRDCPK